MVERSRCYRRNILQMSYLRRVTAHKPTSLRMARIKETLLRIWRIPYVKHPLLGLLVFFALLTLAFLGLDLFTRHGSEFPIPDLTQYTLEEAKPLVKEHHLRIMVTDSSFNLGHLPGQIESQTPTPGSMVKQGRSVFLTINASTPPMVEVPFPEISSFQQRLIALDRAGFDIGKVILNTNSTQPEPQPPLDSMATENDLYYTPKPPQQATIWHEYVQELRFQGQTLDTGTRLPKGSLIDIVIGFDTLKASTAHVPQLANLNIHDARRALASSILNIGAISYDQSIKSRTDSLFARVYSSSPNAGTAMTCGSTVDLRLTINQARIANQPR